MNSASSVLDLDPEPINMRSLDFAKPKLFFHPISHYTATSTMLHVRIRFNFTQVFKTKENIANTYKQVQDKHKEPLRAIIKSLTNTSLDTIETSLEDFREIIKALPQTVEISMLG